MHLANRVGFQKIGDFGAIVLTNFFFGCKDPYTRNQMHEMERERTERKWRLSLSSSKIEKRLVFWQRFNFFKKSWKK
jgi:hypothetical protein